MQTGVQQQAASQGVADTPCVPLGKRKSSNSEKNLEISLTGVLLRCLFDDSFPVYYYAIYMINNKHIV